MMVSSSPFPEALLHYIWQHGLFDLRQLQTVDGQTIQLIQRGQLNRDQGPDFRQARLRVGEALWQGHVEIHLRSQDWYHHGHDQDAQYNPTILHVVWESNGQPIYREDGTHIPEITLKDRVEPALLGRYQALQLAPDTLACASLVGDIPPLHKRNWVERLAVERLETKVLQLKAQLDEPSMDWQQLLWQEFLSMMGGPVNRAVFRLIGRRLPWQVMQRHRHDLHQIEALLFGAAGLLHGIPAEDPYATSLQAEWQFLQAKYQLDDSPLPLRFLRMRPVAFPTIRLAQVGQCLIQIQDWLALLTPAGWQEFQHLSLSTSSYWQSHTRLGEASQARPKPIGKAQKSVVISNVLIPLGFLSLQAHVQADLYTWLEDALTDLPAERNRITRQFEGLNFPNENALHSQGLIQLYKQYCTEKRCLACSLGQQLLRRGPESGFPDRVKEEAAIYLISHPAESLVLAI